MFHPNNTNSQENVINQDISSNKSLFMLTITYTIQLIVYHEKQI